jgi:DNA repair protein RAD16
LDEVLLRRTKVTKADDIQLPARIVKVRKDVLDEKEEDFYQALYTQSQAQFNTYVRAGTVLNNYAHIFDILIRLRQAVVHPYLVTLNDTRKHELDVVQALASTHNTDTFGPAHRADSTNEMMADTVSEVSSRDDIPTCMLCEEPSEDYVQATCGHGFCRFCITDYLDTLVGVMRNSSASSSSSAVKSSSAVNCPCCQKPITIDFLANTQQQQEADGGGGSEPTTPASARRRASRSPASTPVLANQPASTTTSSRYASNGFGPGSSVWDVNLRRRKSILSKIDLSKFQTSTKMEALMEELHNMIEREPNAKAIVFSQFVNMLELLDYRIQSEGMHCTKILGSMSVSQRDEVNRPSANQLSYVELIMYAFVIITVHSSIQERS